MTRDRHARERRPCAECGKPCRGRTCREHMPGTYPNNAARIAGRRRTWKTNAANQYEQYKQLCETLNEPRQSSRWTTHFKELRAILGERNHPLLLQLIEQGVPENKLRLYRWWLRRFTLKEINELAGSLDTLSTLHHSQPDRQWREGFHNEAAA